MKIERLHNFHDLDYVRTWAEERKPSLEMFELMVSIIKEQTTEPISILELGSGPGFLVEFMLSNFDNISYTALDFSKEMIQIAKERLGDKAKHIDFVEGDLTTDNWKDKITKKSTIIISTWTLHDLFSEENIKKVYQNAFELLPENGLLLNGDFIKPENTKFEYESGRISIQSHLNVLNEIGFSNSKAMKEFDINIEKPATSNNYALLYGQKQTLHIN